MPYKFALERPDYSDLAAGQVLYSQAGRPAFPVRLASEMFQRCLAFRAARGREEALTLFDPCCGAAYHLTALAFLHRRSIREIVASDIDPLAVQFARRNLDLLTVAGLDHRVGELAGFHHRFGKDSHRAALDSARRLRSRLSETGEPGPIQTRVFQADATDGAALGVCLTGSQVDVVLTDIPYGRHSLWQGRAVDAPNRVWAMLDALLSALASTSLVAVAGDKQQKIGHQGYERLERFQIGKRQVAILRPLI